MIAFDIRKTMEIVLWDRPRLCVFAYRLPLQFSHEHIISRDTALKVASVCIEKDFELSCM